MWLCVRAHECAHVNAHWVAWFAVTKSIPSYQEELVNPLLLSCPQLSWNDLCRIFYLELIPRSIYIWSNHVSLTKIVNLNIQTSGWQCDVLRHKTDFDEIVRCLNFTCIQNKHPLRICIYTWSWSQDHINHRGIWSRCCRVAGILLGLHFNEKMTQSRLVHASQTEQHDYLKGIFIFQIGWFLINKCDYFIAGPG